jgi:hypothetical protein
MRVGALFLLLLWAAPSRAEQELAVYPGAVHTRIGRDLLIGGQYHRMAYFTTTDSLVKVARYFHDAWTKQGYPVVVNGDLTQEAVVSAFSTREGLQRAVVLRTHQGKTVGFTVLKDLWLLQAQPSDSNGLPFVQVEGSLFSADVGSRDAEGGSLHRTQVVERGLEAVRQELVTRFTRAGYTPVRESGGRLDGQRTLVLEYTRASEQALITLVELEPSRVALSQTWVGTDARERKP